MGVTNRLRPKDVTTIGKITPDPEDVPDSLGLADIDRFAQFIRGTKVPPRDVALAATAASWAGEEIFENIGCATCHVSAIVTAPPGTSINGGAFTVPEALGTTGADCLGSSAVRHGEFFDALNEIVHEIKAAATIVPETRL